MAEEGLASMNTRLERELAACKEWVHELERINLRLRKDLNEANLRALKAE